MNTKALITTLAVLGSTSSLAMANPTHDQAPVSASANVSWTSHAPSYAPAPAYATEYQAPIVRDHGYTPAPPPVVQRHDDDWGRRDGWGHDSRPRASLLADGLTYGAGEFRKDIVLQGRGRFNAVTLQEEDGRNFIAQVVIEFTGGGVQSIPVNRTLRPNQSMTFDLDGTNRAINRIFVYRAYDNHVNIGFPSGGEFSVSAL
jgi:hypothetical protein